MASIESGEKKNREFYLGQNVEASSLESIIKGIIEINKFDAEQEKKVVDYKREPIELTISSYGGYIYDGLGLLDIILLSKTPVHTICIGKAMSMGFMLMIVGHKRFATPRATFMHHQASAAAWGELEKMKRSVEETQRLEDLCDELVLEKTNILKEKLDSIRERCMDWFIDAKEAKKLGIIDEILETL